MFMAAGNLLHFGGHDRIADLDRVAQRLPLTFMAFSRRYQHHGITSEWWLIANGYCYMWQCALANGRGL